MKDFIIVGAGLAGINFAEVCRLNGKSFIVISDTSHNSTRVAAGIYNPVILKRFSLPADAAKHMAHIIPFYQNIQDRLGVQFMHNVPMYRKFASIEEQNNWFEAADKPALTPFLDTEIKHKKYPALPSPYGFGSVYNTGYMDTNVFLDTYCASLLNDGLLLKDTFDYSILHIAEDCVQYKDISAKHIVFAEGFGIHANPYFNYLPLDGTKGELLLIKAPDLQLDVIVNASMFILPFGNGYYKVGATYEWGDKTQEPTEVGKQELVKKLEELITCDYEIIEHLAGVRPTVKDRKPLIGTHPKYSRLHLLNGLGTRGVMLGPPMALELFESIEKGTEIPRAINLTRFKV
ncbi:FAD-binding oxidoreductase [Flavobacterium arcticum]|uniref:FAD-binding oxidoreductase n=1 Tax=Flavobacterium arcticum TaxID=1784713 RepID=A0A345H9I7_9FLAO|nr:FAD-dependent oxidoreductase [Flavobacterium arcticum]AXG73247.1 FAD-binding oxidoreductase [Flavobacterium arcticum]KAF2513042.1 FAD-dependent oxidoreductase [Flavobacterium arcticum]